MRDQTISECTYVVDVQDQITGIGPGWLEFAQANGAPELTEEAVIGRPLYDYIAGEESKRLYRLLLERVRASREAVRVPFRCDDAETRRFMDLRLSPLRNEQIEFTGRLLRTEKRLNVPLFDPMATRSRVILQVCTWCKKVRANDGLWLEVEEAISQLGLFENKRMPSVLHAVCLDCEKLIRRTVGMRD